MAIWKKIVSLFLVLVMLGSLPTPVIAIKIAENSPILAKENSELHKDVEIIEIDPNLENLTPYWIIIAVGSEEKGKLATFKYIDSSKSLKDDEKEELKRFDKYSAFQNLGYASHLLTDVGNPLHTGAELRQIVLSALRFGDLKYIHFAYEGYVSSNWNSGYNFKSIVESNWYYYSITDPEKATKDLANYAHQYADTIVWTIFTNPDIWHGPKLKEDHRKLPTRNN